MSCLFVFKNHNSISDMKNATYKVLTYYMYIKYCVQFEMQILHSFVNFKKKVSMSFYNFTNYSYMFKSLLIFGDTFTVSITLVMEYFIYRKVIILVIMERLHTRLLTPTKFNK